MPHEPASVIAVGSRGRPSTNLRALRLTDLQPPCKTEFAVILIPDGGAPTRLPATSMSKSVFLIVRP